MREVKLGTILDNAARLAGRDPLFMPIPAGWKVLAGMAFGAGMRALAAEKFPAMQRIEFRRYRPDWSSSETYLAGNEVWSAGHYWRLDDATKPGAPGVAEGWTELKPEEVAAFIAFAQPWENTVIDRGGIDVNAFAFAADPKYHPEAAPIPCRLNAFGATLDAPAPDGVYVKFIPVFPNVRFDEWATGTLYTVGDIVYRGDTKDVYQCISDVTDAEKAVAPEDDTASRWIAIRVSPEFEPYLTRLIASDLLTEDQGKYQTKGQAEAELNELVVRYHEGVGDCSIRRGRFM